jgi:hypothetical protein
MLTLIGFGCGVKALTNEKVKTIRVKEDTWRELMILKYKLRKQDMNELLRCLLERYQRAEAVGSER